MIVRASVNRTGKDCGWYWLDSHHRKPLIVDLIGQWSRDGIGWQLTSNAIDRRDIPFSHSDYLTINITGRFVMLIILWDNRVNSDSIKDEIFLHEYTHIELHVIITTTQCQSESVFRLFISRSILCFTCLLISIWVESLHFKQAFKPLKPFVYIVQF